MNEHPDLIANHDIAVCIVEDDCDLREEVVQTLLEYGFDVRGFPGSRELYFGLLQQPCDVAILDVGLPGEDGFSVMENLRTTASIGIIMFTARGQMTDRVRALMGGADAYLVKPVDMVELVATIVSLARRLHAAKSAAHERGGGWCLSDDGWLLSSPAGGSISLSGAERSFLQVLAQHVGITVSREELIRALGHHADEVLSNRLDMLVSRLRRKVAGATSEKLPLHSVRGIGFALDATVDQTKPER
jgi:two-component system, OmpR family, response regulator PhoP